MIVGSALGLADIYPRSTSHKPTDLTLVNFYLLASMCMFHLHFSFIVICMIFKFLPCVFTWIISPFGIVAHARVKVKQEHALLVCKEYSFNRERERERERVCQCGQLYFESYDTNVKCYVTSTAAFKICLANVTF